MDHPSRASDGRTHEIALRKGPGLPAEPQLHGMDPAHATFVGGAYAGSLLEYWRMIRRHPGIVIIISAMGALIGFLLGLPQTPVYRSRATLEVQPLNENLLNTRQVDPTPAPSEYYGETDIQTQIKLLQSDSLIERAVAKLK